MKTVYSVTYGGGHVALVDLVCRELLRRGNVHLRILALTTAYREIVDRYPVGTVRRMADYLDLFDAELDDVLRHGQRLAAGNHDPTGRIPRIESVAYLGLSYADLAATRGEAEAERLYAEQGRQAFLPIRTLKRILHHERADVVLSTTSPRCEEATLLAGNELEIPTVEVLDLFGELYPLPAARHVVTSDHDSIDTLRRQGVTHCQFYDYGQPCFEDTAQQVARVDIAEVRRRTGIDPGRPVLLVATGGPCIHRPDYTIERVLPYEEFLGRLFPAIEEVRQETGAQVLLRRHPNEPPELFISWFERYPGIRHANPILSMFESLAVADCVTTPYSTIGIQAHYAGKRVVTFKFFRDQVYPIPRLQRPPYLFADDFAALPSALKVALREEVLARNESIPAGNFGKPGELGNPGQAVRRIADLLESLAAG